MTCQWAAAALVSGSIDLWQQISCFVLLPLQLRGLLFFIPFIFYYFYCTSVHMALFYYVQRFSSKVAQLTFNQDKLPKNDHIKE